MLPFSARFDLPISGWSSGLDCYQTTCMSLGTWTSCIYSGQTVLLMWTLASAHCRVEIPSTTWTLGHALRTSASVINPEETPDRGQALNIHTVVHLVPAPI
jgi:hypothetical protein